MSPAMGLGDPYPWHCGARPVGRGPSGSDLGLWLAPRGPAGPIRRLCGEQGWAEVRVLASESVGPSVLAWGAFECGQVWEGPARSPALNDCRCP